MQTPETVNPQARDAMLIDNIEGLRRQQLEVLEGDEDVAIKQAKVEQLIDDYLAAHEVTHDQDRIRAKLRSLSADNVDDFMWRYGEWADDKKTKTGPRGDDLVHEAQESLFGRRVEYVNDETDDTEPISETEAQRHERLEQLAEAKHVAYVDKQNTGYFTSDRQEKMAAYEAAEAAYSEALKEDLRIRFREMFGDEINPDQHEESIKEVADEILRADSQAQYDLLMEKGGRRAKLLAKYEQLSTWKKIGVGALAAMGGGAVIGFAGGLVGAGVAAGTAAYVGYRSFSAHFLAKSRIYKEPNDETGFTYDGSAAPEEQIVGFMNQRTRRSIHEAETARRNAVYAGIGAAAISGTLAGAAGALGAAAHVHWSDASSSGNHWTGGQIEHWLDVDSGTPDGGVDGYNDPVDPHAGGVDGSENSFDTPDADIDQPVAAAAAPADSDIALASDGQQFTGQTLGAEAAPDMEIPTYSVSSGEGWYETFGNLGVDDVHTDDLLDKVGDDLVDMGVATPHGDSYWITAPGELPHEATELIMTTAQENGWLEGVTPAEALNAADSFSVEPGHGLTHELIDAAHAQGVEMTPEQAWGAHTTIVDAVGPDYIDLSDAATTDIYSMGDSSYEVGISAPSEATWSAEAQPLVADAIDDGVINGSVDAATIDTAAVEHVAGVSAEADLQAAPDAAPADTAAAMQGSENSLDVGQTDTATPELSAFESRYLENTLAGNYSNLNTIADRYPELRLNELVASLRNETFTDGSRVIDTQGPLSARLGFIDKPDGASLRPSSIEIINNHLQKVGLSQYQLSYTAPVLERVA